MTSLRIVVLAGFTAVAVLWSAAYWLGPAGWIGAALAIAALYSYLYLTSGEAVLRLHKAREAAPGEFPEFERELAAAARRLLMAPPRLYVIPETAANSLVAGGDGEQSAVAVTEGLLGKLDAGELRVLAAHEVARIRMGDAAIECVVARLAMWLGGGGLGRAFVRLSLSPRHEFEEDSEAVKLAGGGPALASLIEKMRESNRAAPLRSAHAATDHLWMVNPGAFPAPFETHLPVLRRVGRLK